MRIIFLDYTQVNSQNLSAPAVTNVGHHHYLFSSGNDRPKLSLVGHGLFETPIFLVPLVKEELSEIFYIRRLTDFTVILYKGVGWSMALFMV